MNDDLDENISSLKSKYILICILVACLVAVISSGITFYYIKSGIDTSVAKIKEVDIESVKTPEEGTKKIAESLQNFRDVIDKCYIGEIDEKNLLEGAIKGYVSGLGDEYSEYMTAEEWKDYQADALGNYVGVGIYMSMDKRDNIVVVAPIKGTPAEEAGVQAGDIIVQIDDESAVGMTSNDAASKIKGQEGTKVKLKLLRENDYVDVELERKAIKVFHVESEMKDNEIGYIKLITFDEDCSIEVKKAYEELKNQGAKKIIFDLRNNTGGLVDEALAIADFMIEKDKDILITVDSNGNKEYSKSTSNPGMDCPIVVLVNEYSASASEILTGALKDNKEATVIGTTTYGKGVIQNVFQLNDGSALKLTIAEYYTPNETKINKIGIEPDEVVEDIEQGKDEEQIDEQLNRALEVIKDM